MTFPLQQYSMIAILLVCAISFPPPSRGLVCSQCPEGQCRFNITTATCEPKSGGVCYAQITNTSGDIHWNLRRGCTGSAKSYMCINTESDTHQSKCCGEDKCNKNYFDWVLSSTVSPPSTSTTTTISSTSTTNSVETASTRATPTKVAVGPVHVTSTASLARTAATMYTTASSSSTGTTNAVVKTASAIATPTVSGEATPTKNITEESEEGDDDSQIMLAFYFFSVLLAICVVVMIVVIIVCVGLVCHYKGTAYNTALSSATILESALKEKGYRTNSRTNSSISPV